MTRLEAFAERVASEFTSHEPYPTKAAYLQALRSLLECEVLALFEGSPDGADVLFWLSLDEPAHPERG